MGTEEYRLTSNPFGLPTQTKLLRHIMPGMFTRGKYARFRCIILHLQSKRLSQFVLGKRNKTEFAFRFESGATRLFCSLIFQLWAQSLPIRRYLIDFSSRPLTPVSFILSLNNKSLSNFIQITCAFLSESNESLTML